MKNGSTTVVFNFIVDFKRRNDGISPTVREIMEGTGMSTTSMVAYHLGRLEELGKIRFMGYGKTRGILVNGGVWRFRDGS